jgi:hypothetical protein
MAQLDPPAQVTFELSYETHTRKSSPMATTVDELRRALLSRKNPIATGDFTTASWRIASTSFAPDAFFGVRTQRACSAGCALHQATSIDMWSSAFVAAPAAGAEVRTNLKFSDLDSLYGAAPRAVISYIGFGEYHGFVVEFPGGLPQTKASCH